MTQEDKELLLKDLSGRLTYGVKINYSTCLMNHCIFTLTELNVKTSYDEQYDLHYYPNLNGIYNYFDCLPYLRPISSMTKEEKQVLELCNAFVEPRSIELKVDFYNQHHLDYRGLIEKGLALEAPKDMYKEEEK